MWLFFTRAGELVVLGWLEVIVRLTGGAGGGGGGESSFGGMFNGRVRVCRGRMGRSGGFIGRSSGGADVIRMTVGRTRRVRGNGQGGHDEKEEKGEEKGRRGRKSHGTESEGVREAQTGRKQQGVNTDAVCVYQCYPGFGRRGGKKKDLASDAFNYPAKASASMHQSTGICRVCLSSGWHALELQPASFDT